MINCKHLCMMLMLALCTLTAQAQEAELIRNGDFELNPRVERGTSATTVWDGPKPVVVVHVDPISADNPNYAVICCDTIYNVGFDGIPVVEGAKYDFSVSLRHIPALKEEERTCGHKLLIIQLVDEQRKPLAEATIRAKGCHWQKYETTFTANAASVKARLAIIGIGCQKIAIDKVSLKKHE
ncbi:hypothetical protein [Prevotella sp. P6B1]|uniref:hypothetical protein n=1 Tax=Prevotella sp. P6B1 TaxID=1410613 RepID=UPI0012DF9FDF|nr:hypothetical protein [Prevotella sp. P6B1]